MNPLTSISDKPISITGPQNMSRDGSPAANFMVRGCIFEAYYWPLNWESPIVGVSVWGFIHLNYPTTPSIKCLPADIPGADLALGHLLVKL